MTCSASLCAHRAWSRLLVVLIALFAWSLDGSCAQAASTVHAPKSSRVADHDEAQGIVLSIDSATTDINKGAGGKTATVLSKSEKAAPVAKAKKTKHAKVAKKAKPAKVKKEKAKKASHAAQPKVKTVKAVKAKAIAPAKEVPAKEAPTKPVIAPVVEPEKKEVAAAPVPVSTPAQAPVLDPKERLAKAQEALRKNKGDQKAWMEKVAALSAIGSDDALDKLDDMADAKPSIPEVHAARARILVRQRDTVEALNAWQRAVALDPANDAYKIALGDLAVDLGRKADAVKAYQAAKTLPADAQKKLDALLKAQ